MLRFADSFSTQVRINMIKKELIEIVLTTNARKHYEALGYDLPEESKCSIQVWSTDLPKSSKSKITRVCDSCMGEHIMSMVKYTPICRKCNSAKMSKDRKDERLTTCIDCGCKISYKGTRCKSCFAKYNSGENNHMFGKKLDDNHPIVIRNKLISEDPTLHPNYKDGNSLDSRNSNKFKEWSEEVKNKYDNTCDCCGYNRRIALKAHHLYSYEANKDIALDVENGVALCANCHEEFHKQYGYGNNTKEQYIIFKEVYNG